MPGAPVPKFGYTFGLSPANLSLVYVRDVAIMVNGVLAMVQTLQNWRVQSEEAIFQLNDQVSVKLTDVDQAGNKSPPSDTLTFTVLDDIPPPKPSKLTILSKRQIP